jgi:hypothetical protein
MAGLTKAVITTLLPSANTGEENKAFNPNNYLKTLKQYQGQACS